MKDKNKKLHYLVEGQIGKGHVHNVVAAVQSYDRSLDFAGASGVPDHETDNPMTPDTPYFIASVSKTYTAAIVMMLYEQGRFFLTDPVAEYLPEFKDVKVFVRETETGIELANLDRPITIHDLLTHTAGLSYGFEPDSYVDQQYQQNVWMPHRSNWEITLEELVRRVARCPLPA